MKDSQPLSAAKDRDCPRMDEILRCAQALIVSLPTAVSGSLFFALRSPGVYAWGGGPKHPFSFPVFPLQGTLCVQSPEERPLKGPKEKGKEFFCCPCDPAVNGWATERRKRACPASLWQPNDQGFVNRLQYRIWVPRADCPPVPRTSLASSRWQQLVETSAKYYTSILRNHAS